MGGADQDGSKGLPSWRPKSELSALLGAKELGRAGGWVWTQAI